MVSGPFLPRWRVSETLAWVAALAALGVSWLAACCPGSSLLSASSSRLCSLEGSDWNGYWVLLPAVATTLGHSTTVWAAVWSAARPFIPAVCHRLSAPRRYVIGRPLLHRAWLSSLLPLPARVSGVTAAPASLPRSAAAPPQPHPPRAATAPAACMRVNNPLSSRLAQPLFAPPFPPTALLHTPPHAPTTHAPMAPHRHQVTRLCLLGCAACLPASGAVRCCKLLPPCSVLSPPPHTLCLPPPVTLFATCCHAAVLLRSNP